ncbi:LysR family transcriptional regulator ArgP [Rhodococcus rhodnii]|uniref:HTH-type transcriptional regulator LysG n=2 Tax=Rhodococcus rhodnii TaxID=38312 RepID=R7WNM2_9NOCA|nr:LysR family transcriptional regulator ArgP [Rhodococcus rhodnii]EOM76903.1 chromosome replication initiation inhibitor [Rhodococcus rhodnii LMG 5362]TXG92431.1 LysR family transcriptional regulator ArgP [Rhodococcus rhodnii]
MDIEFSQLRTFAAVVDEGTFDAAARILHVTPSAVSQRIKALEQQVGRVLVQRGKPVRPTESGEIVLRMARQVARVEADAMDALVPDGGGAATVSVVVNADSLTTWMIPALARVSSEANATFELHRADEYHSTELLRDGTAMAAVTSEPEPVQGCSVSPLGSMRYRAICSAEFARRWFERGADAGLAAAPMLVFDRKDDLQARFLRSRPGARDADPPRHYIPGSTAFVTALRLGLGWGMVPDLQAEADLRTAALVEVVRDAVIDVPLYWQRWKLDSPILAAVTAAVEAGAREALEPLQPA